MLENIGWQQCPSKIYTCIFPKCILPKCTRRARLLSFASPTFVLVSLQMLKHPYCSFSLSFISFCKHSSIYTPAPKPERFFGSSPKIRFPQSL